MPAVSPEGISFSVLASNAPIELKIGRADLSSLVHSRECAKTTTLFVSCFSAAQVGVGPTRNQLNCIE